MRAARAHVARAEETFWIARVHEFFAARPVRIRLDASRSLRLVVHDVLGYLWSKQREICRGPRELQDALSDLTAGAETNGLRASLANRPRIATLATSVSMSARRSLPGTGRGRDRRLPSAGGK